MQTSTWDDMTWSHSSVQKKQMSPPGTQILCQIPKGGEANRGQMPHKCPPPPPLGLNIGRCITKCKLHWCYIICTGVTIELHCSQLIRIEQFLMCILLQFKQTVLLTPADRCTSYCEKSKLALKFNRPSAQSRYMIHNSNLLGCKPFCSGA